MKSYILRVYKNSQLINRYDTKKKKRFLYYTRLIQEKFIKFKDLSVTIRVNYGMGMNALGQKTLFHNVGTYTNWPDLKWAVKAFDEV